jgi:serine/threonine-protein phosphatase 2B catalytic subunit
MLAAVLNICTQEELKEGTTGVVASVSPVDNDFVERRRVIKNKILAVGRMAHLFSVLRWASWSFPH